MKSKKDEAIERLNALEKETALLRKIIEAPDEIYRKKWNEITSFEDALESLGLKEEDILPFAKPSNTRQEWMNDIARAETICCAIKEGEKVNWSNSSEAKWRPWYEYKNSGFGFSHSATFRARTRMSVPAFVFRHRQNLIISEKPSLN